MAKRARAGTAAPLRAAPSVRRPSKSVLGPEGLAALAALLRAKSLTSDGVVVAPAGKEPERIRKFLVSLSFTRSPFRWVDPEDLAAPVCWEHGIRGPVKASLLLVADPLFPASLHEHQELLTVDTLQACIEHVLLGLLKGRNDSAVLFENEALKHATQCALFDVLDEVDVRTQVSLPALERSFAQLWDEAVQKLWHFRHQDGRPFVATAYRGRMDRLLRDYLRRPPSAFFQLPAPLDLRGTEEQRAAAAGVLEQLRSEGWSVLSGCGGSGKSFLLGQLWASLKAASVSSESLRRRSVCPLCDQVLLRDSCDCGFAKPRFESRSVNVLFCAPTNRAVAVLQKVLAAGDETLCCTIQALSCKRFVEPVDLLVVDEASMLCCEHADVVLRCKACRGAALLLVGDHLQLPPVGPGEFFRPLLARAKLPVLGRNLRATQELSQAVEGIRQGRVAGADSYFSSVRTLEECFAKICAARAASARGAASFQVLALRNEERVAFCRFCIRLHREQGGGRPADPGDDYASGKASPFYFRPFPGMPVRFNSNKFKPQAFRGSLGTVERIEEAEGQKPWRLLIDVAGAQLELVAPVSFLPFDIRPAFCITVHDAQGGEFDDVHVLMTPSEKSPLCNLEMLYTAASRARKGLTLWSAGRSFSDFEEAMAKVSPSRVTPFTDLLGRSEGPRS